MTIPRFLTLNTGHKIPTIGFGTYMLLGDVLKTALDYAIFVGYRHIDTAPMYENEAEIGDVIDSSVKAGKINRKDLFITAKIPNTHMRRQDTIGSAQQTLHNFKTNYVDMLLIHHPWAVAKTGGGAVKFDKVDFLETWGALVSLFQEGKALSIGVSNFTIEQLERISKSSGVSPANVQLECHAYLQQRKLKAYCDSKRIVVSAYAAMGASARPSEHVQNAENLFADPVVVDIAKRYKKTPGQILLNFLLRQGFVVLPKSGTKTRIKENLDSASFTIGDNDFEKLLKLDRGVRFFRFLFMKGHPEYFGDADF